MWSPLPPTTPPALIHCCFGILTNGFASYLAICQTGL